MEQPASRKRPNSQDFTVGRSSRAKRARVVGTCDWIFDDITFQKWRKASTIEDSILWVNGPLGSGKTCLAQHVAESLQQAADSSITVYYSCEATSTPLIIINSILRQLSEDPKLPQSSLQSILGAISQLQLRVQPTPFPIHAAWDVFESVVETLPSCSILIDGLDELSEQYVNDADFNFAKRLLQMVEQRNGALRLYLSSRNTAAIRNVYRDCLQITLTTKQTASDIRRCAINEIQKHPNLIPYQDTISNILLKKADGIFIWVLMSIQALSAETNEKALMARLEDLPPTMNELYISLASTEFASQSPLDARLRDIILVWTLSSVRDLTSSEIGNAINASEHIYVTNVEDQVIRCCGSFLKIENGLVKPVHYSLREFFRSSATDGPEFEAIRGPASHQLIVSTCLQYLTTALIPGELISSLSSADIQKYYPLLEYASLYWVYHFHQAGGYQVELVNAVNRFLESANVFVWADRYLPTFLSLSFLNVPPRPSNSASIAHLFQLVSQTVGSLNSHPKLKASTELKLTSTIASLYEKALTNVTSGATAQSPDRDILIIQRLIDLGEVYGWLPESRADSERMLTTAFEQVESQNLTVSSSSQLQYLGMSVYQAQADSLKRGGKYQEARALLLNLLQVFNQQSQPLSHTLKINKFFALDSLGWSCMRLDFLSEAATYLSQALDLAAQVHGSTSPATLRAKITLAEVLSKLNRTQEAESLCEDILFVLHNHRTTDSDFPPDCVNDLNILASVYAIQGKLQEAVQAYETLVKYRREQYGESQPITVWAEMKLGLARERTAMTEAEMSVLAAQFEELVQKQERVLGVAHPDVKTSRDAIARLRGT